MTTPNPLHPPKSVNKWLITTTVMVPMFIEILDTSVANVALEHIKGSLSAGTDEVTWVLTSYLVSNAVIIPMAAWLARFFGRRNYLIFSVVAFTISSLLCGMAPNLPALIFFRVLQGIGGGGLQPLALAILLETFPHEKHGQAMAVFGMGAIMGPILGPLLGGYLTDTLNWRWIFYINLPFGVIASFMTLAFIHDPPYLKLKAGKTGVDWLGISLLTIGLGCLQVVLDKGEREDWFNSDFIVRLAIISAVSLALLIWVELRRKNPVVDLRVFKDRTFTAGNMVMFLGFFAFFGSIVLLPMVLQMLLGYTAFLTGLVLGPGGMVTLVVMPLVGVLLRWGDARIILGIGLAGNALALWLMAQFNLYLDFPGAVWPRIVQGMFIGFFFVPVMTMSMSYVPKEKMGNASSIINLMRNLGGSFGVAFVTTMLSQRTQFHHQHLSSHLTPYNSVLQFYVDKFTPMFQNQDQMLGAIYDQMQRQAAMLAFNDVFILQAVIFASLIPLLLIVKKPVKGGPMAVH
ncbi:MAG: DHA2 family efflux MFS transporter permease subunit [Deltaproteobacteria bacterium]|nr:DHA2 family efflux MFS transporter permease subunit [Deltaproteobacteria bacterium]